MVDGVKLLMAQLHAQDDGTLGALLLSRDHHDWATTAPPQDGLCSTRSFPGSRSNGIQSHTAGFDRIVLKVRSMPSVSCGRASALGILSPNYTAQLTASRKSSNCMRSRRYSPGYPWTD